MFCASRDLQFDNMMDNCSMVDLEATVSRFTWHRNNKGVRTVSKSLGRAMTDCLWRTTYPEAFVENFCRLHSDHHLV